MRYKLLIAVFLIFLFLGGSIGIKIFDREFYEDAVLELKRHSYINAKQKLEWLSIFGHKRARMHLGEMYAYGWGVARNRDDAIKWFRRAAESDSFLPLKDTAAPYAYYVGVNFANGLHVKRDITESMWWFNFAKEGGYVCGVDKNEIIQHIPNLPSILIAGNVAYDDFVNQIEMDGVNKNSHRQQSEMENFKIDLQERDSFFLVEFNLLQENNRFIPNFGARYKIDKNGFEIISREIMK
jgi:hypothetical protein